ncbi:Inositol-pentakisphosphate 2-kinase [Sporothrix stenoceras]|uniref:Inositol-pentakisphosphate 2-kinase n=1 Tax=Sporothrix stenoceras TaxID=5173 RepID=A0ABR3ZRL3_9PEZI
MAAEADTVADDTLNGRYYAASSATTSAVAVGASLPPRSHTQTARRPVQAPSPLPATPPLITNMPSAVTCTFVGEGSANVVFSVLLANDVDDDSNGAQDGDSQAVKAVGAVKDANPKKADAGAGPLSTHLLRIPKAGPGVSPTTCLEHQAYYSSVLRPLLGADCLVGQHLIQGVVSTGVHAVLNGLLNDLDHSRRRRRDWVGTGVAANVDVALLVEDMTSACKRASSPSTTTTIQCKPKWLVQSPSAPAEARRCRTCALSAASAAPSCSSESSTTANGATNGHAGRVKSAKVHKIKPCPMVLVADPPTTPQEEAELEAALWDYICKNLGSAMSCSTSSPTPAPINASSPPVALLKARPTIIRWMRTTDLFHRMAAIQAEFDPHGALSVEVEADDGVVPSTTQATSVALDRLQTAMTLRDCTCFLRVTTGESSAATAAPVSVSAKLGDLDRKDGRRKLVRWQAQERTLLEGGYYLGTEEPRQQTHCWLERQRD